MSKIKFSIHTLVNELQIQNGRGREDFHLLYREYCTKRIRRLRKKLSLTNINGVKKNRTKFSFTKISETEVTQNAEALQILLLDCERAIAFGHLLKKDYRDLKEENSRTRIRFLNRFRKAVKLSKSLLVILKKHGDEYSAIEGQVYHKFIEGTFEMEREEWKRAMNCFKFCQLIYERLCKDGGIAVKEIYEKHLSSVKELIRMCAYWLSEESEGSETSEGVKGIESDGLSVDLKLKKLLEEKKKKDSNLVSSVDFQGKKVLIEQEKLKERFNFALTVKAEITRESNIDNILSLFDKLFVTYRDTLVTIRDELRKHVKLNNKKLINNLKLFHVYIEFLSLEDTILRNEKLVQKYTSELEIQMIDNAFGSGKKKWKRKVTPEMIVRFYEIMLRNLEDMEAKQFVKDDEKILNEVKGKKLLFVCLKCFYLALTYASKHRYVESFSLLKRTEELYDITMKSNMLNEEKKKNLKVFMDKNIPKQKAIVTAEYYLRDKMGLDEEKSNMKLRKIGKISIEEDLDSYREVRKKNPFLIHFPPEFQKIPCKPLFFDIAGSNVDDVTSIDLDKKKQKKWFGIF